MTDILDDLIEKSGILANIDTDGQHRADMGEYTIDAFVSWEQTLVQIKYPSQNPQWMKRTDCGSHSQHRWGLYDDELNECLQLVVMHNSCLKALFVQDLCRNCEFRHVWRQPCKTPSNIFYIVPLSSIEECSARLEPLIYSRTKPGPEALHAYLKSVPKAAWNVKKIKSGPEKRKQLDRLEKEIEQSVRQANMRRKHESRKTMLEHEASVVQQAIADARDNVESGTQDVTTKTDVTKNTLTVVEDARHAQEVEKTEVEKAHMNAEAEYFSYNLLPPTE